MTVAELIEELKDCPQDAEVYHGWDEITIVNCYGTEVSLG